MARSVMRPSGDLTFAEKEQELAALTAPLLRLDLNSEIDRLQTDEHWLKDGRISKTLAKYSETGWCIMKMNRTIRLIRMFAAVLAFFLFVAGNAVAHCDTMDGPVVRAAKQALKTRNINYVLIWVEPKDEAEIRQAFRQTHIVRRLNRSARALADRYFFETLVRIHRAGEGQPYTGLKPAGTDLGPVIPVADKALENGAIAPLLKLFPDSARPEIVNRFNEASAKKNFNHNDVAAGRKYVAAYTSFLEYLEHLNEGRS